MPFYAFFIGFVLAPTATPISDQAAVDHQHSQIAGGSLGLPLLRRHRIPALSLLLRSLPGPLHQRVQRRIVNVLRPFAGDLRRLFVGPGGRHREAELFGVARGNFLMRSQLPSPKQRATPLACPRLLTILNNQFYFPQFASQRYGPSSTLPEGGKPRRFARQVVADVPVVAAGPIHGLRP